MTTTEETTTHPNGVESAADGQTEAPEGTDTGEASKGNREARYRVERNEAREALAAAEARIAELQTRELHRLAGEHLAQPGDLLELGGVSLADLLDEVGNVDPEAVAEAITSLIEARPGLAKNPTVRAVDHSQGHGSNGGKPTLAWADLFKN